MNHLVYLILKLLDIAMTLFWIFDICNMPFMKMFDTTYPINTLAWILIFVFVEGELYERIKKEIE